MQLTGSQRRKLRALAHSLEPVVRIGQQGLSKQVLKEMDVALDAHELIKVRFQEFKAEKGEMAGEIQRELKAEKVGSIGHILIFYRQHRDPERRKIRL